jgi:drug/metabolite transporter superfamily protein YnfA
MKPKMDKKTFFKTLGINLTLALLLYGLIFINKVIFRPTFKLSHFSQILTGSFPNFIAALLISLCVVNPVLIRKPRYGRLLVYGLSFFIMSILIFDEVTSMLASKQYDPYDIIGSIIGTILAILLYEYLYHRQHLELKKIENK